MAHPSLHDLECVTAVLFAVAVVVTTVRLYLRLQRGKFWHDDNFALLGVISMSILTAGVIVLTNYTNEARSAFYLLLVGYCVSIWSARLSILLTIARFAHQNRQRKILLFIAGFFVFQWILLMVQAFWVYKLTEETWRTQVGEDPLSVSIAQITTTVISNLLLIGLPMWIIRGVRLNSGLRFRLISVFSLSVVTTLAAVAHFVMVDHVWVLISGVVEVFVALSVCNAPVLIPAFLRLFSNSATFVESEDHIVTTIGGSNRNRAGTAIILNQMNEHRPANIVVQVVVASDDDLNKPTMLGGADDDKYYSRT